MPDAAGATGIIFSAMNLYRWCRQGRIRSMDSVHKLCRSALLTIWRVIESSAMRRPYDRTSTVSALSRRRGCSRPVSISKTVCPHQTAQAHRKSRTSDRARKIEGQRGVARARRLIVVGLLLRLFPAFVPFGSLRRCVSCTGAPGGISTRRGTCKASAMLAAGRDR